jgi:hypothetical protein
MPNGILRQNPLHLRSLGLAAAAAAVVLLSRLAIAETIAPSFKSPIRLTVTRPPFVHLGSVRRIATHPFQMAYQGDRLARAGNEV